VSYPGGVSGSGGRYTPGGAQEPACGTQTGGAMRNASRHGADLAYSTRGACTRAGYKRPPGGDAPLSATPPLPRIGGPLSTARVPRRSSWRCDSPTSVDWSIRISPLATPTAALTIYYLMKPRHFQPGASKVAWAGIEAGPWDSRLPLIYGWCRGDLRTLHRNPRPPWLYGDGRHQGRGCRRGT
jgi:hypothetical protein